MNTLNERTKNCVKVDLTQQKFADRLGTTRNNIAVYEVGRRSPSEAVISLICKTFNVSETWLRTGEGEMFMEAPGDTLDALAREYHLDRFGRTVVEKMLKQRAAFHDFAMDVLESLSEDAAVRVFVPAHIPTIEAEAHAEANQQAQFIYQQVLSAKKAAAGMSSESSGPPAGGGTAKQA